MRLALDAIDKRFGREAVLSSVSLAVPAGKIAAVLGPSGCGKSTLLGVAAGLVEPTRGDVRLDGRSLAGVPAERRGIPMVFQEHLLFPGMTVFANVAFGLTMRNVPRDETARRVREALAAVKLEAHAARYPSELSGGQRQRVALARAVVLRPPVILLDEPFSNLDTSLRHEMRELVLDARRAHGFSALLVTHDPLEAFAMADLVAVMRKGEILRTAPPEELYRDPRSRFVAQFVGPASFLPAGDGRWLCLRPEALRLSAHGNRRAVVRRVSFAGSRLVAKLSLEGVDLQWEGAADGSEAALVRETGREVGVTWGDWVPVVVDD